MTDRPGPPQEEHEQVPRPFLFAAGGLVFLTLALIGLSQLTGYGDLAVPDSEPVAMRELRFEDRPSGVVAVHAVPDGQLLAEVASGEGGFLRGTLRALVRERRQHGVGDEVPFRLTQAADGTLSLADPATGRRIHLNAFGPTNAGVFASLIATGSTQK